MANLGIMNDGAFSVTALTATINEIESVPSQLTKMGIFEEQGITTTTFQIEKEADTLSLVPSSVRGASGMVVQGNKRQLIPFATLHLPERATITADEVLGVRAFGKTTEMQTIQGVIRQRLVKMKQQIDATMEWQKIGAIKGSIKDADGVTELLNIYTAFGVDKPDDISFGLTSANTELRGKCLTLLDTIDDNLKGARFSGVNVLCGRDFWEALITHAKVKETYLQTQAAAALRGNPNEALDFGGVHFERYRGKVAGQSFIGANEAFAIPTGVAGMFISRFAPADYMETVNTIGYPYYAKQELMPFGKGVMLECQSNPIHLCTRPRAVIRLTK